MNDSELLPDLAAFNWTDRETFIVFDSDISEKSPIQAAEDRLSSELASRGAQVRKVRLPDGETGEKVGLDDYLLTHDDEDLEILLDASELAQETYERPRSILDILDTDYPETEWVWQDMVLKGEVNLLYGDGGVGKSLMALHLLIRVSLGESFLDLRTMQMPILGLFAEDGFAEVSRRIEQVCQDIKLRDDEEPEAYLWCQPKEDTLLAIIDDTGEVREQPRLQTLRSELRRIGKPALVILDSLTDLFAMNESLRLPVNAAMKRVLGSLCREFGATVLVLAHPSKASMNDGTFYSGSTAFNNAVRQRLTLAFTKVDGDALPDVSPPRTLSVSKSNYGSKAEILLWFHERSIAAAPRETPQSHKLERMVVLKTLIELLDDGVRVVKNNGNMGDAKTPKDFAATIMNKRNIDIPWKRVMKHLNYLCDVGDLTYVTSDKTRRPFTKAQYTRGPKCRV